MDFTQLLLPSSYDMIPVCLRMRLNKRWAWRVKDPDSASPMGPDRRCYRCWGLRATEVVHLTLWASAQWKDVDLHSKEE